MKLSTKAIKSLIGEQWEDLAAEKFSTSAMDDLYDEEALFWSDLDKYHEDYYNRPQVYIAAYQQAIRQRLEAIREEYRSFSNNLKQKHCA